MNTTITTAPVSAPESAEGVLSADLNLFEAEHDTLAYFNSLVKEATGEDAVFGALEGANWTTSCTLKCPWPSSESLDTVMCKMACTTGVVMVVWTPGAGSDEGYREVSECEQEDSGS